MALPPRRTTKTRHATSRRRPEPIVRVERDLRAGARLPNKRLVALLSQILREERRQGALSLIVTGDTVMRRLNLRFRGKNRPTDVLSFPLFDASGARSGLIGEIYCSHDHCRRWSKENGGTVTDELLRLAAHGCLHLLGYDHHNPRDEKRMAAAESRYLRAAGLIRARVGEDLP